jgi:N-acetylmuramoyl-L-alanine amidase-like protein
MTRSHRAGSLRRILVALAPPALVVGLLAAPAQPRVAVARARPESPATFPPTVSRVMPVYLRGLAGREHELRVRGGVLRTHAATRTRSRTLCPGFRFTAVGLVWQQDGRGAVRARIRAGDGRVFGPDSVVTSEPDEGPSPGSPDYHPHRRAADLLWTGPRRCIRLDLRLPTGIAVSSLRATFVNTSGTAGPAAAATVEPTRSGPGTAAPRPSWTGAPAISSRAQWGANPRYFDTGTPGCRAPYYSPRVRVAYVHHTAGSNSYHRSEADDVVRAIYWFHTQERGFCDIAYNYLVSRYGQIFEGRAGGVGRPVTPGSQAGFNPNTFSVSVMGNFQTTSPTRASLVALKRLLAWRLDVAHVPALGKDTLVSQGGETTRYPAGARVSMPTIVGHRVTGLTSCPGYRLFRLIPGLRRTVASTGLPKILRPEQSTFTLRPGSSEGVGIFARGTSRFAWTVSVRTRSGHVVRTLHDAGKYLAVTWGGKGATGQPVLPGKYQIILGAHDGSGHTAIPAMLPVDIRSAGSSPAPRSFAWRPAIETRAAGPGSGFRTLEAVAGTDRGHVWAVGGTMTGAARGHAVVLQHMGRGWNKVAVPSPGAVSGFLSGIAATSPSDVWAVGYRCGAPSCASGGFGERSLIEHRTAGGWEAVASPNPGTGADRLNAVAAVSPTDAWAVGDAFDEGIYLHQPLLEHWDGARWTAVRAPRIPGVEVHMTDILAMSATDIWATGHGCLRNRGCGGAPGIRPAVLHYDGATWRLVRTAGLRAAASSVEALAASGGDLFAVGWKSKTRHSNSRPLAERRKGGRWRIDGAPRLAGVLFGADGGHGTPVWAVGDRRAGGAFRTLTARRTSSGWRAVKSPSPPGRTSYLSSVAVLSGRDVWAVGPTVGAAFLMHWNGSRWTLVRPR